MSQKTSGHPTDSELASQRYDVEIELRSGRTIERSFTSISDELPTSRSFHIPSDGVGELNYAPQDELIGALITVEVGLTTVDGYVDTIEWHGVSNDSLLLRIKDT